MPISCARAEGQDWKPKKGKQDRIPQPHQGSGVELRTIGLAPAAGVKPSLEDSEQGDSCINSRPWVQVCGWDVFERARRSHSYDNTTLVGNGYLGFLKCTTI